jgi:predicted DNA-binding ribbon-helix-helix protein
MTAKAFIEGVVAAKDPKCPLASALRLYIANYFRSSAPRYGLVDPASRLAFRIERPRRSRKGSKKTALCVESAMWQWLKEIAAATKTTQRQLIEDIAASKGHRSLASAVRCHVAAHFAGSPDIYRTDRRLVRARDGGLYIVDPKHRSITHLH